jgi:hypothetical protein
MDDRDHIRGPKTHAARCRLVKISLAPLSEHPAGTEALTAPWHPGSSPPEHRADEHHAPGNAPLG